MTKDQGCTTFLAVIAVVSIVFSAPTPKPDWIASFGKSAKFPDASYATGFGMSAADKNLSPNDKIAQARGFAQGNLVSAIRVNISSENLSSMMENATNGKSVLVNDVKSTVVSRSNFNIEGIEYEVYTDNNKNEPVYVLAYLEKKSAIGHYLKRFDDGVLLLDQVYKQAQAGLAAKNNAAARQSLSDCDKRIAELEEMLLIISCLGGKGIDPEKIQIILAAKNASQQLENKIAETIQEAAEQLAMKIAAQKLQAGKVQVNALMVEDSYLYSQFSNQFRIILERMIAKNTPLVPLAANDLDFTPQSSNVTKYSGAANGANYITTGSFFIQGDSIHLYAKVLNVNQNTIAATAEAILSMAAVKGIELKPRNFMQALQDKKVFGSNEMVQTGLNLETWTNRGAENLILEAGNKVVVFVRVNKPCYIRFIYHLSNGARVFPDPLYQNYYLDENKVNRVVALPDTFEITPPFGSETMQLFASTQKFPDVSLVTKKIDGEDYDVIEDNLVAFTVKTRGIKKVQKTANADGSIDANEMAEKRITLTSVAK